MGYEKKQWRHLDNCILFCTYSSLVNKSPKLKVFRFDRLVEWLGRDSDPVIIFDEAHKAKNLLFKEPATTREALVGNGLELAGTKAGQFTFRLQDQIPKARIIYCSATGVSTVENFVSSLIMILPYHYFSSLSYRLT